MSKYLFFYARVNEKCVTLHPVTNYMASAIPI